MKKLAAVLVLCSFAAAAPPKKYPVGVGPVPTHRLGATIGGTALSVSRANVNINVDGTTQVQLDYINASGAIVATRTLIIAADGSSVKDSLGATIVTPAPTSLVSAITAFVSQIDSQIAAGAGAGKLNL